MSDGIILKKLRLKGFKSFPWNTHIPFHPGITVVVGPNGCGKSNLGEAILWVLGAQAPTEMRASTMADLIFQGSKTQKAQGMAEVEVWFEGVNGQNPSETLCIRRRVFQDGNSQYYLDGKSVLLRDLQDILSQRLSFSSYSIITQGKIEHLLTMRAYERRTFLEEAAGIARFHEKKRHAQLKIARVKEDLERVKDLLEEKKRYLHALRIQAGKARRYKTLKQQERQTLYQYLQREIHFWEKERDKNTRQQKKLEEKLRKLQVLQAQKDGELLEIQQKQLEIRPKHQKLIADLTLVESQWQHGKELMTLWKEEIKRIEENISTWKRKLKALPEEKKLLQEKRRDAQEKLSTLKAELEKEEGDYEVIHQEYQARKAQEESLRNQLQQTRSGVLSLLSQREALAQKLQKHLSQEDYLKRENQSLEKNLQELQAQKEHLQEERKKLEETKRNHDETLKKALQSYQEVEATWLSHQKELKNKETQRAHLLGTLQVLSENIEALGKPGEKGGEVLSFLQFPPWFESFGDTLLYWLIQASLEGLKGIQLVAYKGSQPLVEGAQKLSTLVTLKDKAPAWILESLPPIYYVGDGDPGEWATRYPGFLFFNHQGKFQWGGLRGEPPYPGEGPIQKELGSIRLKKEMEKAEALLKKLDAELQEKISQEKKLDKELKNWKDKVETLSRERDRQQEKQQQLEETWQQLAIRQERLSQEIQRIIREREANVATLTKLKKELAFLEEELQTCQKQVEALHKEEETLRKMREKLALQKEEKQKSIQERLKKLGELQQALGVWEKEHASLEKIEREGKEQLEALNIQKGKLQDQINQKEKEQKELLGKLSQLQAVHQAMERKVQILEEDSQALKGETQELQKERLALQTTLGQILADLQVAHTHINMALAELKETFKEQESYPPSEMDRHELKEELHRIRENLQRLGAVNMEAEETAATLEEEIATIEGEKADLEEALKKLEVSLKELEDTAISRFLETLREVNRHFQEYFHQLFSGGDASLALTDETNPLEGGIDIYAHPEGKTLKHLQLLSGGEKALVALAFLMALFKTRPSPLLILDEVDASLDEANTTRFIQLLKYLKQFFQIILITHNRRTMEVADQMIGVTMDEPGVSQTIALDLERKTSFL